MTIQQCYKLLGLNSSASDQQVKRAYRKLSMKYHPDRNKNAGARDQFEKITKAKDIIEMFRDGRFAFPNPAAPPKKEEPKYYKNTRFTEDEIDAARAAYRAKGYQSPPLNHKRMRIGLIIGAVGVVLILATLVATAFWWAELEGWDYVYEESVGFLPILGLALLAVIVLPFVRYFERKKIEKMKERIRKQG